MFIADTSALYAAMTDTHAKAEAIRKTLEEADAAPVVSPFVLAELDYLVATRLGVEASLAVIDELTSGAFDLVSVHTDDIRAARAVIAQYRELNIGLTDAINVVLADRFGTDEILTLDERHFRTVRPLTRGHVAFTILPDRS